MNRFLQQLHARPAHEKRRFSLQAASGIMAVVFLAWISTLGVRLASGLENNPAGNVNGLAAGAAAVGSDIQSQFGQIQSGLQVVEQIGSAISTTTPPPPAAAPATVLSGGQGYAGGATTTAFGATTGDTAVPPSSSEDYAPSAL